MDAGSASSFQTVSNIKFVSQTVIIEQIGRWQEDEMVLSTGYKSVNKGQGSSFMYPS